MRDLVDLFERQERRAPRDRFEDERARYTSEQRAIKRRELPVQQSELSRPLIPD